MSYERIAVNQPSWQSVMVTRHLPAEINGLERLSKNLWWCWNEDAKALFKLIDEDVWHRSGHNPMDVLDTVTAAARLASRSAEKGRARARGSRRSGRTRVPQASSSAANSSRGKKTASQSRAQTRERVIKSISFLKIHKFLFIFRRRCAMVSQAQPGVPETAYETFRESMRQRL